MDAIEIMGKTYPVSMPEQFPAEDFEKWMTIHKDHMNLYDDFFEMMEDFGAFLFMKYNKDLFVKMMVEDYIKQIVESRSAWFNRNIPL